MSGEASDEVIRQKLRSFDLEDRTDGFEALVLKYRDAVCGYLSWCLWRLGYIRTIPAIPDIWQETGLTIWKKAGPNGDIHEAGNLWSFIQGIAHNKALEESRKSARRHRGLDATVDLDDLHIPDARRYDEPHGLLEILGRHYDAFPEHEIWVLELEFELCAEPDALAVEDTKRKFLEMDVVTYRFNERLDQEEKVDKRRVLSLLAQAKRRIRKIVQIKGDY